MGKVKGKPKRTTNATTRKRNLFCLDAFLKACQSIDVADGVKFEGMLTEIFVKAVIERYGELLTQGKQEQEISAKAENLVPMDQVTDILKMLGEAVIGIGTTFVDEATNAASFKTPADADVFRKKMTKTFHDLTENVLLAQIDAKRNILNQTVSNK